MASILDVAKYIHEKLENKKVSIWKIENLCYLAQAWTLAWDMKPLYPEDFYAFEYGPRCRELIEDHIWGAVVSPDEIPGDSNRLTDIEKSNIDTVVRDYEPYELGWFCEDPVWQKVKNNVPNRDRLSRKYTESKLIKKEDIFNYYYNLYYEDAIDKSYSSDDFCSGHIFYHIVLRTKRQKKLFTEDRKILINENSHILIDDDIFKDCIFSFPDQTCVHCFVSAAPDWSINRIAGVLKNKIYWWMYKDPEFAEKDIRMDDVWNEKYFCETIGDLDGKQLLKFANRKL